jgi:hypothetical protein
MFTVEPTWQIDSPFAKAWEAVTEIGQSNITEPMKSYNEYFKELFDIDLRSDGAGYFRWADFRDKAQYVLFVLEWS